MKLERRKDVYNNVGNLSLLFTTYYKNMSKMYRELKGNNANHTLNKIITDVCSLYFDDFEAGVQQLHRDIHIFDFLIRDMFKCKMLSKKQKINLSMYVSNIIAIVDESGKSL